MAVAVVLVVVEDLASPIYDDITDSNATAVSPG